MSERWQRLSCKKYVTESESNTEEYDDVPSLVGPLFQSQGTPKPKSQYPKDATLRLEGNNVDIPVKKTAGDGFVKVKDPRKIHFNLENIEEKELEEDIPEMSQLSISHNLPALKGKKKRLKRIFRLARPKSSGHILKYRTGCCRGIAWISPYTSTLHFSLYWPSKYWTQRFLEDTTLSVTVPEVSPRLEELAQPKRFYSEYCNIRPSPIWPISRATLEHQASDRLKALAVPKTYNNNIWSRSMAEVSRVSKAAQIAIPSSRILSLSKPRSPASQSEKQDHVPKPKTYVSDYNRLLRLATPKTQSDKCILDRDPRWQVLDITKKAVASPRIIFLAKPKERKELNGNSNSNHISHASVVYRASSRILKLATPKSITKKVVS